MRGLRVVTAATFLLVATAVSASAQITTGTVAGSVKDASGAVVPGATVVLVSEAKGTKSAPAVTNETGDYVLPNVTADTYTVEVTMSGFKTVKRTGVAVSGGSRVVVPAVTLEPGGAAETVNVTAEAPMIQAQSGERSFSVATSQIENLPINHGNFTSVIALVPGVKNGAANQNGARLGSSSQDNIMMDGISAVDTGNNGQMINMNIESIAEVKVLTQGYQAEYGRSSGLQITAVTKSGTNHFRGSGYSLLTDSDWNSNSWAALKNGDAKASVERKTYGYSIGGPVGKPGANNKLFFFYAHEYRPVTSPINNGNAVRLRVPTAAERAGDFSQSLDQNGNLFNLIKDPLSTSACTAANTAGCFADGGVLGKIPANRLYSTGLSLLSRYPLPTMTQAASSNFNYQTAVADLPTTSNLTQQPAIKVDYAFSPNLRVAGKYSGERQRVINTPGSIPGFNDVTTPYPFITNYAITANYTLNPTTFIEATYGMIRNEVTGGGSGGMLTAASANRVTSGLAGLPLLYPNAGLVPGDSYTAHALGDNNVPYYDGKQMLLPPTFAWGGRIGAAPPNQQYPGWLNINRTQDFTVSVTKVTGHHTIKGGFYNNHSYKAQNVGTGGGFSFQGNIDFGNDNNNPLDSGFGFANAALGVFRQYTQASTFVEGSMLYNNTEGYIQDNWKLNGRLTVDYGLRLTHQQPQYDQYGNMSNFFTDQWNTSQAQVLYTTGCLSGATVCSGNDRNARNPITGQIVTAANAPNTSALIGTPIEGVGNPLNGIKKAGDGISKYSYTWPGLVLGPRFGMAYDLTGKQNWVVRGGMGLFFDRPDGNTVFSVPANPPIATGKDLRNGTLQTLGQGGLSPAPVPTMQIWEYDAKIPASLQYQAGVQIALPWSSSLDVSYVGNHGYDRLGGFQAGGSVNLNAIDFGSAYLAKNQDPTLGTTNTVPGANAYTSNLLRPYAGLNTIGQQTAQFHDTFNSIQTNFNRRFRNGLAFGVNWTYSISFTGNTGLTQRIQHAADGTITLRSDQGQYEELMKDLNLQRHLIKANFQYELPKLADKGGASKAIGYVINDWQLSGILSAGSGSRYDLGYSYQGIGATNLTGSPDYNARIVYVGDPGSGCSSDQYRQFNVNAVTGPTYNSVGLESGRNVMSGCWDKTVDLALVKNVRLGAGRNFQFRLDAFNAFNTVVINGRNTNIQYNSPTDLTIRNSQTLPDGSLDPNRLTPRNAGFGAATSAQTMRNIQLQFRYQF